ncbi:MAG: hypothetical protein ACLFVO_03980 [Chloroflexaceae bacterium]
MHQQHEIFEHTWSGVVSEYPAYISELHTEHSFATDYFEETGSYPVAGDERGEVWFDDLSV